VAPSLKLRQAEAQAQAQPNLKRRCPRNQCPRVKNPDTTMGPGAGADAAGTATGKVDDKKFVKDAALGGMTEVELGKLAAQKASDPKVKEFGQQMVDDHTKANENLKQIATKSNIPVPDSLDAKHQSRVDKLSKLSGEQFDKAYLKDQLKDHETDVREFKDEANNGSDPNVKTFASGTLPKLQEHLDMVKSLNKGGKQMSKR